MGKLLASILECKPVTKTEKRMGLLLFGDSHGLSMLPNNLPNLRNVPFNFL